MTTLLTDFFVVQGVILDASLLFAVAMITSGFVIQGREKRRERREQTEGTVAVAETIMCETRSKR